MRDNVLNIKKNSNIIFEADGVFLNMMSGDVSTLGYYPRRKRPAHNNFHTHSWYEIFYVLDGSLTIHFKDESVRVEKNSVIFVPPLVPHYMEIDEKEGASRYSFDFSITKRKKTRTSQALEILLSFEKYLKLSLNSYCRTQLNFFAHALSDEDEVVAGCHFLSFLLSVSKVANAKNEQAKPVLNDTETTRLYKIERLCSSLYAQEFPLSMLADELHLSERQVERIIKKHYGCGFHALITSYRMHDAQLLLIEGTAIGAVAEAVGYSSTSSFHRAFRNTFGMSPNEFLQQKTSSKS